MCVEGCGSRSVVAVQTVTVVAVATKLCLMKPIMASRLADAGFDEATSEPPGSPVKMGEGIETC